MSALAPNADISRTSLQVRFVPGDDRSYPYNVHLSIKVRTNLNEPVASGTHRLITVIHFVPVI